MDLHWTCDARDHLRLFVDGALVAEIAVAPCRARDTLAALARQVRALGDQLLAAPPPSCAEAQAVASPLLAELSEGVMV